MQEIARRIAKVSTESKLPIVEDEYVQSFKVELMDAVVQWCRGASFSEICKVCISSVYIFSQVLTSVDLFSSSPTNSKAASSESSAGCRSSSAR